MSRKHYAVIVAILALAGFLNLIAFGGSLASEGATGDTFRSLVFAIFFGGLAIDRYQRRARVG